MPKIVFSQRADAITDDPFDGEAISDPSTLSSLHGLYIDESILPDLDLDGLDDVIVGGGKLRLVYCPKSQSLRITTAFDVTRDLTGPERDAVLREVEGQWSDGAGAGCFVDHLREVASRSLAMAMYHEYGAEVEIEKLFIDTSPFELNEPPCVEFFEKGQSEDDFVADLQKAVDQGDSSAMAVLGQRYLHGEGVEHDPKLAFSLFEKSSQKNNPIGQVLLGICLQNGDGCSVDLQRGFDQIALAASTQTPFTLLALGECYSTGKGVKQDHAKAIELYRQGADQGDPACWAQLGDCFEFGVGVDVDLEEALTCYEEALSLGFDEIQEAIDRVQEQLEA